MFSPPLNGYFIPPADSWLWGDRFSAAREQLSWPPEMALMPGAALLSLGILGLVYSPFRARYRVLAGVGVLVSGALGLGSNFGADGEPGYLTLSKLLLGWDALRTPGRLMVWTSLLLAILAAGMVTELQTQIAAMPRGRQALRAALLIPLAIVCLEAINRTPHPPVPAAPAGMRAATEPILVLPSDGLLELNIMLWSTDGFPRIANGLTNFVPASQEQIRRSTLTFPDSASVAILRQVGIRSVVVLPDRLAGTPWAEVPGRPTDNLGISREQIGDALVYRLS
jgi:hypothetical protein